MKNSGNELLQSYWVIINFDLSLPWTGKQVDSLKPTDYTLNLMNNNERRNGP